MLRFILKKMFCTSKNYLIAAIAIATVLNYSMIEVPREIDKPHSYKLNFCLTRIFFLVVKNSVRLRKTNLINLTLFEGESGRENKFWHITKQYPLLEQ